MDPRSQQEGEAYIRMNGMAPYRHHDENQSFFQGFMYISVGLSVVIVVRDIVVLRSLYCTFSREPAGLSSLSWPRNPRRRRFPRRLCFYSTDIQVCWQVAVTALLARTPSQRL